jgi:hypothetical protein
VDETATGSIVSPHTVRTGTTPLSSDGYTAKERREELLASDGCGTVVGATSVVDSTTRVNDVRFEV